MLIPLASKTWRALKPLELFGALSGDPTLFWLEFGGPAQGWSYLGAGPSSDGLKHSALQVCLDQAGVKAASATRETDPPFSGGWIIQLDYPGMHCALKKPVEIVQSGINARHYPVMLAYSHVQAAWYACVSPAQSGSRRQGVEVLNSMVSRCEAQIHNNHTILHHFLTNENKIYFRKSIYIESIIHALKYISEGDIYQINLAQAFNAKWEGLPEQLHAAMRAQGSADYGAYLGAAFSDGDRSLCCGSPELFLEVRGGEVVTRPIKGTRALGAGAAETLDAARELETNAKERAELNMIVDLERNDLGRVCEYGSVRVESAGAVQVLPGLLHRTAAVRGRLRAGVTLGELLAATFPGGSITGAPKVRAMELIAELEGVSRGAYCGAIGWVGFDGDLQLNIAIRTAQYSAAKKAACYFAGSGIVADSEPLREYEETVLKARGFLKAVNGVVVES